MEPFGVERLLSTEANTSGGIPQSAGVYLVYAPQYGILYVGSSKNMQVRWQQHHWRYQLGAITGSRIAWISVDPEAITLRKALENTLIARLRPPINAETGTGSISLRRQWFAKFKQDGYYPEFKGDRQKRGPSPQSKILSEWRAR